MYDVSRVEKTRREFLKTLGLGAVAMAIPRGLLGTERKDKKHNFIVILADDLGYGDIGCFGSKIHKTPNLDVMAQGGVRFTDFHSNGAMCSPTRAALLTGRYQQRAGIQKVLGVSSYGDKGMALEQVTFAEVLKKALFVRYMLNAVR